MGVASAASCRTSTGGTCRASSQHFGGCSVRNGISSTRNTGFDQFIRHYDRYYRGRAEAEEAGFLGQPTLRSAISCAALARFEDGTKFQHQWHLKNSDLCKAKHALLAAEQKIAHSSTFDELYRVVWVAVQHIWKNPELYCYDTAVRIGAKLGLKPEKIYLHRGTRIGARKLGLQAKGATLDVSDLPRGLRGQKASRLEDMLCIYKNEF